MKASHIRSLILSALVLTHGQSILAAVNLNCLSAFGVSQRITANISQHARELISRIQSDPAEVRRLTLAFDKLTAETLATRAPELRKSDLERVENPNWLEREIQYMGYVNFIGSQKGRGTFGTLSEMTNTLVDKLGVTMIYTLPFLTSPFRDGGFDIAGEKSVDARFGGNKEFIPFRDHLGKKNGTFQMDIILNHLSSEHRWAKAAVKGDAIYRKYFHILETPPRVLSVEKDKSGFPMAAKYLEKDASGRDIEIERRVIFPEFADPEHPHYVKMKDDQGKTIWVYHTFYPFQFDLNYTNPRVVGEALGIVGYWANQGVDVIRLDAIPFLFKNRESDPRTLAVVELMRYFLAQVSPRTAIIVEANQPPPVVYKYYGEAQDIPVRALGRVLKTTSSGQLAYNFDLMGYMWASLLSHDKAFFLDALARTPTPPNGTVWANFLRLHDELTLEMVPESVRKVIRRELLETKRGEAFRGDLGVGGRMADFLNRDPRWMKLAHSLILSLRGMPILYYGDEIMTANNPAYAKKAAEERGGQFDARDVGRGPVEREDYERVVREWNSTPEGQVFNDVRRLIEIRKQNENILSGETKIRETSHRSVAAYSRMASGGKSTLVVHNLADHDVRTTVRLDQIPKALRDRISERKVRFTVHGKSVELKLAPYETLWLEE